MRLGRAKMSSPSSNATTGSTNPNMALSARLDRSAYAADYHASLSKHCRLSPTAQLNLSSLARALDLQPADATPLGIYLRSRPSSRCSPSRSRPHRSKIRRRHRTRRQGESPSRARATERIGPAHARSWRAPPSTMRRTARGAWARSPCRMASSSPMGASTSGCRTTLPA